MIARYPYPDVDTFWQLTADGDAVALAHTTFPDGVTMTMSICGCKDSFEPSAMTIEWIPAVMSEEEWQRRYGNESP